METLNNIWVLLTTESELLTKIISSPTVIIELWLDLLLFTSILKISYKKSEKWIYILTLSLTSLLSEFFVQQPFNLFVNYPLQFIAIKHIFKQNNLKTLLAVIIPTMIFALVGTLILNPFLTFLHIDYLQTQNIPIYRILYLFIFYIIILTILIFIKLKNLKLNVLEEFTKDDNRLITLNIIFGFLIICIQSVLTVYYVSIVPVLITLLNFVSLFLYFFISLFSLKKTMKLQVTTAELENAEHYNNSLSVLYDNVKAFKHDFDNMVFTIGGFVDTNDLDGLKRYYKDLVKDCQHVNSIALLNPNVINNGGIYNLLMTKYKKAQELQVKIDLEIFFDFTKLHMPIYEFARILGILIDNAIEAANETLAKNVKILIRDSVSTNTQIICISNTYQNKEVDINKIFEKGISEKENHQGMGLWEVKQILSKNNNINLITNKDENYFKQQLEIYY